MNTSSGTYAHNFTSQPILVDVDSTMSDNSMGTLSIPKVAAVLALSLGTFMTNYVGGHAPQTMRPFSPSHSNISSASSSLLNYVASPVLTQKDEGPISSEHDPIALLTQHLSELFVGANISLSTYIDHEESWSKTVIEIGTGIVDFEEKLQKEDEFYAIVEGDAALRSALNHAIISFI